MDKFTVRASIILTQEDVDDIMAAALEGGITYWCGEATVIGEYLGEYASEQISRGGELDLHDLESDDVWRLDLKKFLSGVQKWIEDGAGGISCLNEGRLDTCQIDAVAADQIVQYALFEDLVFG